MEKHLIEYTVTFRVPDELVVQDGDEPLETAVQRAASGVLYGHTDQFWYGFSFEPDDPYSVTARVEWEYAPGTRNPEERVRDALGVISRMLGQRCLDRKHHEELRVELHSDKEALELLVREGRADMRDIEGHVYGYLY